MSRTININRTEVRTGNENSFRKKMKSIGAPTNDIYDLSAVTYQNSINLT